MLTGDALLAKVKELYGKVDLSQFVDKKVRVTLRSGGKRECDVKFYPIRSATYPYIISYVIEDKRIETTYTKDGRLDLCISTTPGDITHIEEIKPMNKYEELEKQVAEMQKEIDRLKREEKNYPNLKPLMVIRTVVYTTDEYLEHCEDWNEEPTQDGFREYVSCWKKRNDDCFADTHQYTQEIKVVDN